MDITAGDIVASLREDRHSGLETQLFIAHRALTRAGEVAVGLDEWLDAMSPAEMRATTHTVEEALSLEVAADDPT